MFLAAGLLDIRAERAFSWPEKQEIGELRLNFVQLSKKASRIKLSIIHITPLITGILLIWFISTSILDIGSALELMREGTLEGIGAGLSELTRTTDFWLWVYIVFAIANSMMPDAATLRGWGLGLGVLVGVAGFLWLVGLGSSSETGEAIFQPIIDGLNLLASVFGFVVALNLAGVAFLGTIESTIEWITGDSATFKNGKMITMRREEVIEMRKQEREKARAKRERDRQRAAPTTPAFAGIPSVYKLEFPLPGPPGKEPVSQSGSAILSSGPSDRLGSGPSRPSRAEPDVIPSQARPSVTAGSGDSETREAPSGPRINTPRTLAGGRTDESTEGEKEERAIAPRPAPSFGGLASRSRDDNDIDDDEEAIDDDRDEDDGEEASGRSPFRSASAAASSSQPFSRFASQRPAAGRDDDEDDNDEESPTRGPGSAPAASSQPFSRFAPQRPPAGRDNDEDDDSDEDGESSTRRPAASSQPFSRFAPQRPASATREGDDEDAEEDEDEGEDRSSALRPTPFSSGGADSTSRFGARPSGPSSSSGGQRPSPFSGSSSRSGGLASRLGGPSRPSFGRDADALRPEDDDIEDDDFEDDEDDDLDDDEPRYEDFEDPA